MRMPKLSSLTRLTIFLPVALIALFASPARATTDQLVNQSFSSSGGGWAGAGGGNNCAGGNPSLGAWQANALNFSYIWNVVTQTVVVAQPSTVLFKYTVQDRPEEWINGRYQVTIADTNQSVTSGVTVAPDAATTRSLSISTTQPNEVITISIAGDDNGLFWAGCYGPIFTTTQLIVGQPETVWVELNEGWSGTISASGGVFTSVVFASYGTPNGSNGTYTQGSCHAQSSRSIIESELLGKSSAVLDASNGIFGDPCGGTYKRLYVTAEYIGVTPPTTTTAITTTTTTTEPQTTTTEEQTTTTTTTTEPQTTTTEEQTTTTEEQTTTTEEQTTTTTELVTTTTEPIPEETTTTEIDVPTQTTIDNTDTDPTLPPDPEEPDEPSPETTVFEPAPIQEDEAETPPVAVEPTTAEELINDIASGEATDEQIDAFLEDALSDGVTAEAVEAIVDIINTGSLDPEKVQEIVAEILAEEIDNEQAVQLATSPELLQSITSDQAEEIFASVDVGEISEEEASQIVAAVQNAVEEVRKAFETEINVFGGKFDTYVPTGSRVTVAERRVVVAAGAVLFMAPVVSTTSINTTTSNSAPNRKQ